MAEEAWHYMCASCWEQKQADGSLDQMATDGCRTRVQRQCCFCGSTSERPPYSAYWDGDVLTCSNQHPSDEELKALQQAAKAKRQPDAGGAEGTGKKSSDSFTLTLSPFEAAQVMLLLSMGVAILQADSDTLGLCKRLFEARQQRSPELDSRAAQKMGKLSLWVLEKDEELREQTQQSQLSNLLEELTGGEV